MSRGLRLVAALALVLSSAATVDRSTLGATAVDSPDLVEYASFYGVDLEIAAEQSRVIAATGTLEEGISRNYPDEFAGLWIQHQPTFAVVVAMTSDRDSEVSKMADPVIRPYLALRRHEYSIQDLQEAARAMDLGGIKFNRGIDPIHNEVFVEVLTGQRDAASARVATSRVPVRLSEAPTLGGPGADIYGGLNIGCVSGFAVKDRNSSATGVTTAGHCEPDNTQSYNGTNLPFVREHWTSWTDIQFHTTPGFVDSPRFKVSDSGTTRWVTGTKSYSNIVVGSTVCKYGYASASPHYNCGEVEMKTYEPSWLLGNSEPVFILVKDCGTNMGGEPGDSGGPVFYGNTAYGTMSGWSWGGIGCWTDKMVFTATTHLQNYGQINILLH